MFDVDLQPGNTYQYRLRVSMANPNYNKQKEVASPAYAASKEPLVSDWFEIPQSVTVPPEYHLYAVDQNVLDGNSYRGQHAGVQLLRDPNTGAPRQAVFQIHKWLKDVLPTINASISATCPAHWRKWSVADACVLVYLLARYIGGPQRGRSAFLAGTKQEIRASQGAK